MNPWNVLRSRKPPCLPCHLEHSGWVGHCHFALTVFYVCGQRRIHMCSTPKAEEKKLVGICVPLRQILICLWTFTLNIWRIILIFFSFEKLSPPKKQKCKGKRQHNRHHYKMPSFHLIPHLKSLVRPLTYKNICKHSYLFLILSQMLMVKQIRHVTIPPPDS